MAQSQLTKARICSVLNPSDWVECQFNPNEYTVMKQNKWTCKNKPGENIGKTEFGGGKPATLKLKLFFDTSMGKDDKGKDVRNLTDKLWKLSLIDSSSGGSGQSGGEPPQCIFQWGEGKYFTAVIKKVSQKFIMFLADGTPVRAKVDITLQQYKDDSIFAPQNPTSRSAARKVWEVVEGETLDWIAYQEYGDPNKWRHIAKTNDLDDPRALYSGQILNLTPLA